MTIRRHTLTFTPCADCTIPVSTHIDIIYHYQEHASRTYQFLPLCPTHPAHEFLQRGQAKEEENKEEEAGMLVDNQNTKA